MSITALNLSVRDIHVGINFFKNIEKLHELNNLAPIFPVRYSRDNKIRDVFLNTISVAEAF